MTIFWNPLGTLAGASARQLVARGLAVPLLGGSHAAPAIERIELVGGSCRREVRPAGTVPDLPPAFATPRPAPFDRPRLMGILNVTPDSFSDGGTHAEPQAALAHAEAMLAAGADLVDVGGESTRPGAAPVPLEEELKRVLPVVRGLARAGALVSIDTRKAAVMRAALDEGATILNDVSGLSHDPEALAVAAGSRAWVVLMHMQGEPGTMNLAPAYEHCALEVYAWFEQRLGACERAGLDRRRILLDPGLCFGKHEPHNLDLLRHLAMFHGLGCPLLLGASRKGWTEAVESYRPPARRLSGSLTAGLWALGQGACCLRVHDVPETRQAVDAWAALVELRDESTVAPQPQR